MHGSYFAAKLVGKNNQNCIGRKKKTIQLEVFIFPQFQIELWRSQAFQSVKQGWSHSEGCKGCLAEEEESVYPEYACEGSHGELLNTRAWFWWDFKHVNLDA